MRTARWIGLGMLATALLLAGSVHAQNAMEEAMQKAATPGPQHQLLASQAGNWNLTVKSWMEPGKDPVTQTGTCTSHMVLDGRFLQEDIKMSGDPMPFAGMGLLGYDNIRAEYFTLWMDSMGTGAMVMHGQMDSAGKVMTMTGTYPDPMSKQDMIFRSVTTYDAPDHFTAVYYVTLPGGSEMKNMEMTGQRVK